MKLMHLTDEKLLDETQSLVKQEREITLKVLHHLREIERRRLFSALKYESLFNYCVQHLKYSESSAQRRIQAMRALRDLPEIEEKIETGVLSLSNLATAQSLFYQEKKLGNHYSKDKKLEILERLENKSRREAERTLAQIVPQQMPPAQKLRVISEELTEMKLVVDQEFLKQLEVLKGLLAHKMPNATMQEIIKFALEQTTQKLTPSLKLKNKKVALHEKTITVSDTEAVPETKTMTVTATVSQTASETPTQTKKKAIPASVKRYVWQKAESKCEICTSMYAPQTDHIIPFAKGGTDEPENLRLLCRNCNQRQAIEKLGLNKMQRYLNIGRTES